MVRTFGPLDLDDDGMSDTQKSSGELKNTGYELFIAALSILSIVNVVLIYAFRDDENLQDVLFVMNALLSFIFFGRLPLSPVHRTVEVGVLPATVRLGRSARLPAVQTGSRCFASSDSSACFA